jgi:predicted dehydrogenase
MNKHRIGILGAGMYGRVLMRWFQQDPRASLLWTNSATQASAESAAQEFGVENWSTDYRAVLADPKVDAVVIAAPPYLHAELLTAALQAGKHVLLEKPMAESTASLRRILAAVQQHPDLLVLEASCRHTCLTPKFRFIKALIDEGKLGQIYHIHHNHLTQGTFIEWNPNGAWAMSRKLAGGGPFIDMGVYDLSFHLGLLDNTPELLGVRAFHRSDLRDISHLVDYSDVEQHGAAWMEFSGGLTYYYERGAGVHAETTNETRLYGTRGGLRFQYLSWDSPDIEFFSIENGQPHREILTVDKAHAEDDGLVFVRHFLDCLDGSARPLMTPADAARHLEILFKILA